MPKPRIPILSCKTRVQTVCRCEVEREEESTRGSEVQHQKSVLQGVTRESESLVYLQRGSWPKKKENPSVLDSAGPRMAFCYCTPRASFRGVGCIAKRGGGALSGQIRVFLSESGQERKKAEFTRASWAKMRFGIDSQWKRKTKKV